MNQVFLTGNRTRQPELKLKMTPAGVKICSFGLASWETLLQKTFQRGNR